MVNGPELLRSDFRSLIRSGPGIVAEAYSCMLLRINSRAVPTTEKPERIEEPAELPLPRKAKQIPATNMAKTITPLPAHQMPNFSVDHVSAANEKPGCKRRIRLSASTIRSAIATAATNASKILTVTLSSNIAQSAKIVYPPAALTYCAACKTASTEIRKLERLQRIVWNWPMAADSRHCGKSAIIWDTPTIAPTHSGRIAYGPAKKAVRAMPRRLFEVLQKRSARHENFSL